MARGYNGEYDDAPPNPKNYQRDIILSINEFCFVQNKSNGSIRTHTGPIITSISGQESLVVFDSKTKRFTETQDFEAARQHEERHHPFARVRQEIVRAGNTCNAGPQAIV